MGWDVESVIGREGERLRIGGGVLGDAGDRVVEAEGFELSG